MILHSEIVKVVDDTTLYDDGMDPYQYTTANGRPLLPGYYMVSWPPRVLRRRYDEHTA